MEWLVVIVSLVGGYIVGLNQGGIHIHRHENVTKLVAPTAPLDPEYNESTEALLPDEIQDYMAKNNGFIGF